jgi:serine protease Do
MKRSPRLSSLSLVVGLALTSPGAFATGAQLDLLPNLSENFLVRNAPGYLGVDIKDLDNNRISALKLKDGHGAEVVYVDHDAPAAKAGLKVHDVILQMNGEPIDGSNQLRRLLRELPAGRTVTFVISRDGSPINVTAELVDRAELEQKSWLEHFRVPEPPEQAAPAQSFVSPSPGGGSHFLGTLIPSSLYVGADLNPVRTQLADYFGITSGTGLLVESVDTASPAARAGLRAGDVVLMVDTKQMVSRSDWQKAIRNHRGTPVQLTIMRDKQQMTLTMIAGEHKKKSALEPPLGKLFSPGQLRTDFVSLRSMIFRHPIATA